MFWLTGFWATGFWKEGFWEGDETAAEVTRQGGAPGRGRFTRLLILKVGEKTYEIAEEDLDDFLATQKEKIKQKVLTVTHMGKAPKVEIVSAPQEILAKVEKKVKVANNYMAMIFAKALVAMQERDDEEALLWLIT